MFRKESSATLFDQPFARVRPFIYAMGAMALFCRTMGRTRYMFNKPDICSL
jgi:hypothetical protein